MNKLPTQDENLENLPALSSEDLQSVGFPEGVTMAPALALFLNDRIWKRCRSVAMDMSLAEGVMPTHLLNKPAACFAVISFSITWNLSPYMVARSTYQTPGGSIGFEGKLIQAILENSGKLEGGLKFEYKGDWSKVKGKFTIQSSPRGGKYPVPNWTPEDARGLSVIVSAKMRGEAEPRTLEFELIEAFPLNSPLWATAPHRQILYTAARAFGNHACPGLLMGVPFDVDPTGFYGEPMKDITPGKPEKASEFAREPKKPGTAAPAAVTEVDDFSTPVQTAKPADASGAPAESQPEAKRDDPPPAAAVAVDEPGSVVLDDAVTNDDIEKIGRMAGNDSLPATGGGESPSAEEEFEKWLQQMYIAKDDCRYVRDVTELKSNVLPHLNPTDAKAFEAACDIKQRALLAGTRKTPAKGTR